jgi:protocatechuate 3,4-dioxygenase beta subunit
MTPNDSDILSRALRRRDALITLGGLGLGAFLQTACGSGAATVATTSRRASSAAVCVLSPEVTEGPYYIANHLTRRDITDDRPGLPLALHVTVVDADTCSPIEHADVEIWHADAIGVYSGFSGNVPPSGAGGHATPNNDKRFLRGHQRSGGDGRVLFDTIYPGWYRGRTPHIHMKVHVGGSVVHTGQLFFADRTSDAVYRTSAYEAHGQPDITNAADSIYAAAGGSKAKVHLTRRRGHRGIRGRITVGVKT